MSDLVLLVLTTNFKDGASIGLDAAKRLDRDGWIELMDYTLFENDEKGRITVRRSDDEILEKVSAAAVGVNGDVMGGAPVGPIGAAGGTAAGALIGGAFARHMESVEHEQLLRTAVPENFPQNSSILTLLIEERYAERLEEKFEKVGQTVVRALDRAECEAELHAYLRRSHNRIRLLEEDISTLSSKLRGSARAEKIQSEADLAGKQAELQVIRDKVRDHIEAMAADLYTEIREMNARVTLAGRAAKPQIAACVDQLQRELDGLTDQLEELIENRVDFYENEAYDLKRKASNATGELKVAIEAHALVIESLLRKERDELGDSFEQRLLQTKQWFDILRVRSGLANAEMRTEQRDAIENAQHALQQVKARVRMRHRKDEGAWKDVRQRMNNLWETLADVFDRAGIKGA